MTVEESEPIPLSSGDSAAKEQAASLEAQPTQNTLETTDTSGNEEAQGVPQVPALEKQDGDVLPQHGLPFKVVGIGTSAGGLEALERFLNQLPNDLGMAYVLVQHLSPDYKSFMQEVLSKHTELPLSISQDGMELEPNHIYLIPPKQLLRLKAGRLRIQESEQRFNLSIDIFFRSLAQDQGEGAIAIVLSGTGTDGTLGIREIKGNGGVVLVQSPQSAQFDGMPRSAIASGAVDMVVPPEQMPSLLQRFAIRESGLLATQSPPSFQNSLARLFDLVRQETGSDFNRYKPSTITRRLKHRMNILQIEELELYLRYILQHPEECHFLHKEFLIGVTQFFRNPSAFDSLTKYVFPLLFEDNSEPIRIWSVGCSTGEEAYSLAMSLHHYASENNHTNELKVFATDLDQGQITYASMGKYPESIEADIPAELLKKYFVRQQTSYTINDAIRRIVIFAKHDVHKDPPFSRLDLISCRNVLIYMKTEPQQRMLSSFHFSLKERGFLFLGNSESIGDLENLYTPIDSQWKIYRQHGEQSVKILHEYSSPRRRRVVAPIQSRQQPDKQERFALRTTQQRLIQEHLPPSILTDSTENILGVFGNVQEILQFPGGSINLNLMNMLRPELTLPVGTLLHKLRQGETRAKSPAIRLPLGEDESAGYTIEGQREKHTDDGQELFCITFHRIELAPPKHPVESTFDSSTNQFVLELQQELIFAKETLQANLEELESTNEELQATNEELLASNEELQSTNEELQSVNEELHTINSEYQQKLVQMTTLNNDLNNLLTSSDIGTMFLDLSLSIRKFTPEIKRYIHVLDSDIGRPLAHIATKLSYPGLVEDAQQAIQTSLPIRQEVSTEDGKWVRVGLLPYRTVNNLIQGVVLNFVDISELKETNARLETLTTAVELNPSIVMLTDVHGIITYVNQAFVDKTQYSKDEVIGSPASLLNAGTKDGDYFRHMWQTLIRGDEWSGEFHNRTKEGSYFIEVATVIPLKNEAGKIANFLKMAQDITEQRQLEKTLLGIHRKDLRVLIVEDIQHYAVALKVLLHSQFIRHVSIATTGIEALDMLQRNAPYEDLQRPDLIFLDIRVPGYDGHEILEKMSLDEKLAEIPVIVVSDMEEPDHITRSLTQRAKAFVQKPIDADKLHEVLENLERFSFTLLKEE